MNNTVLDEVSREFIDKYVISGILTCFLLMNVCINISDYYENQIPSDAEFHHVISKSRDPTGGVSYDDSIQYENELYDHFNYISEQIIFLPIIIGILLYIIKLLLDKYLSRKIDKIKANKGEKALKKFYNSSYYLDFNRSPIFNFGSGYLLGLLGLILYKLAEVLLALVLIFNPF